jgi:hypothetical protein
MTGDAPALDFEIHLVRDTGGALKLDLCPIMLKLRTTQAMVEARSLNATIPP